MTKENIKKFDTAKLKKENTLKNKRANASLHKVEKTTAGWKTSDAGSYNINLESGTIKNWSDVHLEKKLEGPIKQMGFSRLT